MSSGLLDSAVWKAACDIEEHFGLDGPAHLANLIDDALGHDDQDAVRHWRRVALLLSRMHRAGEQ